MGRAFQSGIVAWLALAAAACPAPFDDSSLGYRCAGDGDCRHGNVCGPSGVCVLNQTVTVSGTSVTHHLTDTAPEDDPVDLSGLPIAAWVPDVNADGGFDFYAGTGTDSGTFAIPGLLLGPGDPYYLELGPNMWVEETDSNLDLGAYADGRDDRVACDSGTFIAFAVQGMARWQAADALQFTSEGAGFAANLAGLSSINVHPDSGQSNYAATLDYHYFNRPKVDGRRGDKVTLYQLGTDSAGVNGINSVHSAKNVFSSSTFTVIDNATTPLAVTLASLPLTPAHWVFDAPAFQQHVQEVHPFATLQSCSFGVNAVFGTHGRTAGLEQGFLAQALLAITSDPNAKADLGGTFGNPFPTWTEYGYALSTFSVWYSVPLGDGGTAAYQDLPAVGGFDAYASFPDSGSMLEPRLSPVRDIQLDGQSATGNVALTSLTPVLSWTPPAVGTPTFYHVLLLHLVMVKGVLKPTLTEIYLVDSSLRLPPGVLVGGGEPYILRVGAWYQPHRSLATPFVASFPEDYAEANTGLVTTP